MITPRVRAPTPHAFAVTGVAVAMALAAFAATASSSNRALLTLAAVALAPYAVLTLPHLRRVLLAAVVIDVVLQWDVNLGYRPEAGELGAEAGLNFSLTTLALAGLWAQWAVNRAQPGSSDPPLTVTAARPLIAYVAICALSVLVARDPVLSGYYLALLLQTLLLFVYVVSTVRARSDLVFLLAVLVAGVALEAALVILQYATGLTFSVFGLSLDAPLSDAGGGADVRASGTLGSPNTAATVLTLLLPAALGLLLAPTDRTVKRVALAALVLGVPALVLTGSRGGWLAFVLSCVTVVGVILRRRLVPPRVVVRLVVPIAVLLLPLAGFVAQRVTEADPASAQSRLPLARLALEMIEDHPVLGVGLNNMVLRIPDYAGPGYSQDWLYVVHNKYLLVASEAGVLALGAFVWFLVATVRHGVVCLRSGDTLIGPLALGLLAGLLGGVVLMSAEIYAGRAQVQALWLLAALLAAMASLTTAQRSRDVSRARR